MQVFLGSFNLYTNLLFSENWIGGSARKRDYYRIWLSLKTAMRGRRLLIRQ
ncbi:hypothetical protein LguiA_029978 [Lonicera macranthoides]